MLTWTATLEHFHEQYQNKYYDLEQSIRYHEFEPILYMMLKKIIFSADNPVQNQYFFLFLYVLLNFFQNRVSQRRTYSFDIFVIVVTGVDSRISDTSSSVVYQL